MQPSDRVFDRDFSTPSSTDSAAVQDQRLGSSLVFDTIFTIFCSGLWWETYESVVLCSFLKGRGACWISLTDGSVSNNGCCPRLTQMEGAGGKAGSGVRAKEIFGSLWNTAYHVCRFDSGARTFVFLFSLVAMPSLTGVWSWESGLWMLQNSNENSEVKGEERDNVNIIWLKLICVQIILTKNSLFFSKADCFYIYSCNLQLSNWKAQWNRSLFQCDWCFAASKVNSNPGSFYLHKSATFSVEIIVSSRALSHTSHFPNKWKALDIFWDLHRAKQRS